MSVTYITITKTLSSNKSSYFYCERKSERGLRGGKSVNAFLLRQYGLCSRFSNVLRKIWHTVYKIQRREILEF